MSFPRAFSLCDVAFEILSALELSTVEKDVNIEDVASDNTFSPTGNFAANVSKEVSFVCEATIVVVLPGFSTRESSSGTIVSADHKFSS